MRRAALVVGILALAASAAADPSLRGVLRVAPAGHCGGAYIRDYKPPPLAPRGGVKLIVRKGDQNSERRAAAELTTASDGSFAVELPAGRYCVVREGKRLKPRKGGPYAALACLVSDWQQCEAVIDVPVSSPAAIDLHDRCFSPCYHGPMPP